MATDLFPVSEELTSPEQSTAQPAQRRGKASRGEGRDKKLRRWAGQAFLLALCLGFVFWQALQFVLHDPRFELARVSTQGGKFVAATEVEEKFGGDLGKSLLRIPLRERRLAVEQVPWVQSATVVRVFPNQVWIAIEERTPVAFLWMPEGLSLIDANGVILETPPEASFTFPVVRGVTAQEARESRRTKMQLFAALMEELAQGSPELSTEISEVDLSDAQDAHVVVAEPFGAILLHLGKENFLARYLTYAAHIPEWKEKFPNLRSVDLRYEGQVVLNADPQESRPAESGSRSVPADTSAAASPPVASPSGARPVSPLNNL
ncbi:MAG: FtsQ-type POTRA domain-containing protein [Acidobacteria bacterium]|nr:FtsQ-type POTRA domain-containing protein [Acidobacteriota bacterium]